MPHIDFEKELNAEQLAVVKNADGPCLVLAGAGSGKTRTIVYRVAYLVEHGVDPSSILLLTFTNKAANEMMTRIGELLGLAGDARPVGLWGGTFHSVANRLLRIYGRQIGYGQNFTILDEEDAKALIKACIKELNLDAAGRRFLSPAGVKEILSYARNSTKGLEKAVERHDARLVSDLSKFTDIAALYEKKKRAANAMDFDDLLIRLYELLKQEPRLAELLSQQFRYILVDEYQDTNALQVAFIKELAGPKHNLLVVGDDAQSIYSFRAADVRNILDFPQQFPDAKVFRLQTNYRSTPEILSLANDIIAKNVNQFPKELTSVSKGLEKPAVVPAVSASKEAQFVFNKIEQLLESGVPAREIAVLFRATHHSQMLEFELMKAALPYDYRGGLKFFDRAHVKDTLAFLRLTVNFSDEAAWLRVLGLQEGIGDVSAGKIFEALRAAGSLAKSILAPIEQQFGNRVARGWKDLRDILEALHAAGGKPADLIKAVTTSTYIDYLEAEYPNYRERLEDLDQLAVFSRNYEKVEDFLADVTLDDGVFGGARELKAGGGRRAPSRGDRIVLSTIHQAKGLEWDAVFIIHLNDQSFPNRKAAAEQGGLEEERRLFYVAVTRARKWLFLSYPAAMGGREGGFDYAPPSLFLEEIDVACLKDGACLAGRRTGSRSGGDDWSDPGFDDESVEVDQTGELKEVGERMKSVNDDWKKKSFLRDV
ncbi:MAG: ATP-dependent helicase [Patescibacteria group bacterium]|jgi:DNA helicase-2/ATP-dependent DNA helicase PcrA